MNSQVKSSQVKSSQVNGEPVICVPFQRNKLANRVRDSLVDRPKPQECLYLVNAEENCSSRSSTTYDDSVRDLPVTVDAPPPQKPSIFPLDDGSYGAEPTKPYPR